MKNKFLLGVLVFGFCALLGFAMYQNTEATKEQYEQVYELAKDDHELADKIQVILLFEDYLSKEEANSIINGHYKKMDRDKEIHRIKSKIMDIKNTQ